MTLTVPAPARVWNLDAIRADFPILQRTVRDGHRLIYLDSAATSQKPRQVLDAERHYYETSNAAVHRGAHQLAEEATECFESARQRIATFVGGAAQELVFTRNATEALNMMAYTFLNATLKMATGAPLPEGADRFVLSAGDEVVVTEMEHHANLVPWQELCEKTGAVLKWIGITDDGRLDSADIASVITPKTKVVSFSQQSNLLGTITPVDLVADAARAVGALVVLDACQSVPHMPVSVHELNVDVITWSGHKMLGPTGIGCLWARSEILESMPPFLTGGSMIEQVSMKGSTFAPPPQRFEAGVPMVAQAVGLAAACDYLDALTMSAVEEHEHVLTGYALAGLQAIPGVRIIGPNDNVDRGSAVSFVLDGVHPHDLGQLLDDQGIAVRVGHHCAWPTCRRLAVPATTRLSTYIYNGQDDLDALFDAVGQAQAFFGVN
ncbi:MAG: cysteine desulfurase [Candidatus Nanopelagicales bacterium]